MQNITLPIILVTVVFSVLAFNKTELMARYQFNAYMISHRNQWYRFLTGAFLHADWMHLIVNMLVLWSFGEATEFYFKLGLGKFGPLAYIGLYFGAIFTSSISTYRKHKNDHWYNAVGASGAVSAVLFSSVVFAPFSKILLYGILPLPALVWAALYVAYSVYSSKNSNDNINHDAHLWGGAYGMIYTLIVCPSAAQGFIYQITNIR